MTIRLEVGRVSACPVAGCADLVQARQEASSRYALLTRAPQREIEECARRAMTALAGRPSLRTSDSGELTEGHWALGDDASLKAAAADDTAERRAAGAGTGGGSGRSPTTRRC